MPVITRHGKRRLRERAGVTGGNATRHAQKVLSHGITHAQSCGQLRELMNKQFLMHKRANNLRYYGCKLYIFNGETIITVLNVPDAINNDLVSNVEPSALRTYTARREQVITRAEKRRLESEKKARDKEQTILDYAKKYLALHRMDGIIVTSAKLIEPKRAHLFYVSDVRSNDWERYAGLIAHLRSELGVSVRLVKIKGPDGRYVTAEEYMNVKR